ncbi:hypothetical protein jhhlp_007373 [Lomentospora prolificans]|uniref:Uncharacterized protein n=1 Tax=Lomentospora prolificans TaxID=41688 RepID=A0A2N3N2H6_9PEZI|nr:hypothetical protein jhhlp_007373 [Lomentospora prolificans]
MKVSLWKSAAGPGRQKTGQSIRGKISGPIPIPNPADDEFPMRTATTAPENIEPVAQLPPPPTPPQTYQHSASTASLPQNQPPAPSGPSLELAHHNPADVNHSPPASSRRGTSADPTSMADAARVSPQRSTNQSAQVRYSTFSASSQKTGNTSTKDVPQRKKSTLRGALSKLFGRKKKTGSQASVEAEGSGITSTQHRSVRHALSCSALGDRLATGPHGCEECGGGVRALATNFPEQDPSALNRVGKDGEPKRSASLPITEYDRALRSHSVGIEDITAIESARNSLHADYNFTRRRAATTSSQLYAPQRIRDGEFVGLSPRPASTHGRSTRTPGEVEDPNEIGRAITSDMVGFRRRSRSLSGLQDIEVSRSAEARRRSDEIRYWRESYDPGFMSPLSSNAPEGDDTGVVSVDVPTETEDAGHVASPPEPFQFGTLANMNEMAGMKITHAANFETRLGNLELRMYRMEKAVGQICNNQYSHGAQGLGDIPPDHADASFAYTGSTAPLTSSLYQTTSHEETYDNLASSIDSRSSIGEAAAFVGSLHPPASAHQQAAGRSASNSTVRGGQIISQHGGEINGAFTADHYATLLALVETERSTRQALELKVKMLSRTLHILAAQAGVQLEFDEPPTSRSLGGQSAFDDDSTEEEEDEEDENPRSRTVSPKRQLTKPQDSGVVAGPGDTDDENQSDIYATPREERALGFGAFGEELRDDEGEGNRKKAARTLSLSQLTVNRNQHNTPQLV